LEAAERRSALGEEGASGLPVAAGIDLVEIDRFAGVVERCGPRLVSKLFSEEELESSPSLQSLAARFAAKEAFFKALGTGLSGGVGWHEVEVLGGGEYPPRLRVSGRASDLLGGRCASLSLSHTTALAAAMVIISEE
jgi:holo-[acyl-carrier protein] synthase